MMRRTPLKRTAFKQKAPVLRKKSLEPRGPRMTPIRKSARGEECTFLRTEHAAKYLFPDSPIFLAESGIEKILSRFERQDA